MSCLQSSYLFSTTGLHISRVFLTEYRSTFPTVRITTRDPNSPKAQELAKLGAEVHSFSEPVDDILSGIDVVVNALPAEISEDYKKQLTEAIVRQNTKVYFLSEFGINYHTNDFPGYEHPEWHAKRKVSASTRAAVQGKTKVIELITGMFQGWIAAPDLGIDFEKNVFSPLGPRTLRFATTAESDIARSLARLAILSLDPATAATVPDVLRVAGHNVSYEEVRDIFARVRGVPKGEVRTESLKGFKEELSRHPTTNILDYIRVCVGENKVDFAENANELVNPGERYWKWRTVEDQLRSARGQGSVFNL